MGSRILISLAGLFLVLLACLVVYLFAAPRPIDTTDPSIFLKDGRRLDYCRLPLLDDSGAMARDIPKAYTPDCGHQGLSMPVLASCTESLSKGSVDMRGLWQGVTGRIGHLERIEQCGDRVVVTAAGLIHDFRVDGTLKNGARDVNPPFCMNFSTAVHFDEGGTMVFRPFNLIDAVSRRLSGEELIFTYLDGVETRMKRICSYPSN